MLAPKSIMKIGNTLKLISYGFFDFLAPKLCEVCGEYTGDFTGRLEFICNKCLDRIPLAPLPEELLNKLITFFPKDELAISGVCALFSVSNDSQYMEIIHSLKYRGFRRAGVEFGALLGKMLIDSGFTDYRYIIPVPIHKARRRERGYNQSEAIAEGISAVLGIPVNNNIIIRSKYTVTQTLLSSRDRRHNVSRAFASGKESNLIKGQSVLLVDDVITTGSTLNSCATMLLNSGARRVDTAALASA